MVMAVESEEIISDRHGDAVACHCRLMHRLTFLLVGHLCLDKLHFPSINLKALRYNPHHGLYVVCKRDPDLPTGAEEGG